MFLGVWVRWKCGQVGKPKCLPPPKAHRSLNERTKANLRDLDEIPEIVKKGVTFHPVSRMDEVLELVF